MAAAASTDPRRAAAERLAQEGRCAAALELFADLRKEGAPDADLLLKEGRCEIQLRRYDVAAETLLEAERLDPESGEIRLRLAIALYHLDQLDAARSELDAASQRLGDDDPELLLYQGLLLLDRKDGAAAAAALERARARDSALVEPVASYYAAVAWASVHERERAEQDVARVVEEWPGSIWASAAERLRARLAAEHLRRWARVQLGFEYDTNAILQGSGTPLPTDISSQRDERGLWSFEGGAELFRNERWSGGALAAYSGAAYVHVQQFDSHYPSVAVWLDRRLGETTTVRGMIDSGFAVVDGSAFLWNSRGSLSLLHAWEQFGFSELYARFHVDDYYTHSDDVPAGPGIVGAPCSVTAPIPFCGPPGIDERSARNRDGNGTVIGFHHAIALPYDAQLRGGYEFEHFSARGTEYSFNAHSVFADVLVPLPHHFQIDVTGAYTYRPFRHPSTFPNSPAPLFNTEYGLSDLDRRESFYAFGVRLERPVGRGMTAALAWRYERNRSNTDVFDYDRQIVGAYLTWAVGN
jgi:tetratricopeptide (TPR) repeat protein